mmetsp:Transcript_17157/g.23700  ORF Transcript_17157/g.23700 Transcript_17157/m.23700 type:complete len:300 (-) Transcript_17157:149-1048(-)|eukprot:CAMPEP_0196592070 /NCGR_PEP_ID=MMETSP1081-20130531/71720_1 /TAXON_ID=36882 /ORGANISM="Pyramimonas amylifera, Strain CCMP720" /LENGTH=299 /DNA_ID=CAMNT_0041915641 /DNA_START=86 /DNA_END=985 /DNA_ORIENTATION=+
MASNDPELRGNPDDLRKCGRPFTLAPMRHTKVLHFIRHGQGEHNVAVIGGGGDHSIYKSWDYEDAQITKIGWDQALAVKAHLFQQTIPLPIELVLVSPLTRTLQTAVAVFGGERGEGGEGRRVLMTPEAVVASHHRDPAAMAEGIARGAGPPILAYEGCREMIGVHPCDRRRPVDHYQPRFPAVDFSLIPKGEDPHWTESRRETYPEIQARARAFLEFVAARPETHIAVVTHSAFLSRGLMPLFGYDYDDSVRNEMQAHFDNCEMRSMLFVDGAGVNRVRQEEDPLWFKGGTEGDEAYF